MRIIFFLALTSAKRVGKMVNMRSSTAVQLSEPMDIAKNEFALADPGGDRNGVDEPVGPVKAISVDVPVADHLWLDNYAAYLNELKRLEIEALGPGVKKPKGTRQTRKSLSEEWLRAAVKTKKAEMRKRITDHIGEDFPAADDEAAVRRFVKKALALGPKK